MSDPQRSAKTMNTPPFKDLVTDSVRYWEKRRILYNLVLAAVVAILYSMNAKEIRNIDSGTILGTFLLAVIANVLYCAAYIPDLLLQLSDYRDIWRKWRVILFGIGTLFAGIITSFVSGPHLYD